jgi:hypothetical protein
LKAVEVNSADSQLDIIHDVGGHFALNIAAVEIAEVTGLLRTSSRLSCLIANVASNIGEGRITHDASKRVAYVVSWEWPRQSRAYGAG